MRLQALALALALASWRAQAEPERNLRRRRGFDNKRVVRLSFNQISRTIHALLGDTFGAKADADYEIGAESPRPALFRRCLALKKAARSLPAFGRKSICSHRPLAATRWPISLK